MFFNPTTTQTKAINVECNPDTGTLHSANAPPAAAVESTRKATPIDPIAIRVCVEGTPGSGQPPNRKLARGSGGKHVSA